MIACMATFTACDDDDDDNPTPATNNPSGPTGPTQNIAEIAIADSRTDSLVVALSHANLVSTFQSAGTYTVFAPTNEAFAALISSNSNWNRITDIDTLTLQNVLKYHVLGTKVMSGDLNDDLYANTLNTTGPNNESTVIEIDVTGGVKLNNRASVTQANIEATNGVIHVIDSVIMTQNVVGLALNDERFSTLVSALQVFGNTYINTLSGNGPFTVFAPTNDAFQALLDSDSTWNSLSDIPTATLQAVIEYHVITAGNVQSDQLTNNQSIPTFGGSNLTVDLSNGAQLQTASAAQGNVNIIVTDVQGNNGVIHAVDQVLLP